MCHHLIPVPRILEFDSTCPFINPFEKELGGFIAHTEIAANLDLSRVHLRQIETF